MSIYDELADAATAIADRHHNELTGAEQEYAKLQSQLLAAETRLNTLRSLPERVAAFNKRLANADMVCPVCWFEHGKWSPIRAIGGTEDVDNFRCSGCRQTFSADA